MNRAKDARVILKPRRDAAVLRHHPWIFSGSVRKVEGDPPAGGLVAVHDSGGDFLAWGHYSPHSQIRVRLVSWDADADPDSADFWRDRFGRAVELRQLLAADPDTTAYRLVHAESDGVPGLVVDRYDDVLVAQFLTTGTELRRDLFTELLWDLLAPGTLYERSDVDARGREGLPTASGLIRGTAPPQPLEIREHGLRFRVGVESGHKTGFYLDQRPNRRRFREAIRAHLAYGDDDRPPSVLNVFAYTGGFALYALDGGAGSVVNVDTSEEVLKLGRENVRLNALDPGRVTDIAGDAFAVLRDLREQGRKFDFVVLDPPKFAYTKRDVKSASRGYKDINLQAIYLLKPGGHLFTFSCSGAVSDDLFQKIVFGAALDTGRSVQMIAKMMQGSDHPVALTFPEGSYLKGLVCRVTR